MKVLSIGSAILDKISFVEELPKEEFDYDSFDLIELGGCAANVAVGLAQLNVESYILATLGKDVDGAFIKQELRSRSVKLDYLTEKSGKTGYCKAYVDNDAERSFFNYDGVNLQLDNKHLNKETIPQFDGIYIAGYELLNQDSANHILSAIKIAKEHDVTVYFDPSPIIKDIEESILDRVLDKSDYVILNKDEANAFGHTLNIELCAKMLRDKGAKKVIVKLGNEGCYFQDAHNDFYEEGVEVDSVIDTNGAGDAFMAGFIYAKLQNYSEQEACRYANAVASIVIQEKGSQSDSLSAEAANQIFKEEAP